MSELFLNDITTLSAALDAKLHAKRVYDGRRVFQGIDVLSGGQYDDSTESADMTEEEIIELAIQRKCSVIHRRGPGCVWYLKGHDKTPEEVDEDIRRHIQRRDADDRYRHDYKNICVWVLKL